MMPQPRRTCARGATPTSLRAVATGPRPRGKLTRSAPPSITARLCSGRRGWRKRPRLRPDRWTRRRPRRRCHRKHPSCSRPPPHALQPRSGWVACRRRGSGARMPERVKDRVDHACSLHAPVRHSGTADAGPFALLPEQGDGVSSSWRWVTYLAAMIALRFGYSTSRPRPTTAGGFGPLRPSLGGCVKRPI